MYLLYLIWLIKSIGRKTPRLRAGWPQRQSPSCAQTYMEIHRWLQQILRAAKPYAKRLTDIRYDRGLCFSSAYPKLVHLKEWDLCLSLRGHALTFARSPFRHPRRNKIHGLSRFSCQISYALKKHGWPRFVRSWFHLGERKCKEQGWLTW